jgi:hypothetical protein
MTTPTGQHDGIKAAPRIVGGLPDGRVDNHVVVVCGMERIKGTDNLVSCDIYIYTIKLKPAVVIVSRGRYVRLIDATHR